MTVTPWPLPSRLAQAERTCSTIRRMVRDGLSCAYYAPMLAEQERRAAALRAVILRLSERN